MRILPGLTASLAFAILALAACGDHPGGTVGAACSDPGSSDECNDGEVCDTIEGGDAYCLLRCGDHADCDPGERCNGVSGDKGKACHPNDEDGDDDGGLLIGGDGDGDGDGCSGKKGKC